MFIASTDLAMAERAKAIVLSIAKEPEVATFISEKARILQFGAFVEISPSREGMIHISKLAKRRVNKVQDVVKSGDTVKVEIIRISEKE